MRENMGLYRGKRKDNGEWIEGSLLKVTISGETCYLIFGDDFAFDGNDVTALSHALVDPETIGEYSGLPDKNGKGIFEGDVCRVGNLLYKVEFKYSCWWFTILSSKVYCCPAFNSHCGDMCEIIGNIHDNPELLEVRE